MNPVLRLSARLAVCGLLAFALSACEGDQGPAGPSGTAECFGCHTDDFAMANFLLPIQHQFDASLHANSDTDRRRSAPCSRCHTNEGYQTYIETGVVPDLTESSRISCFTCHAPHSNLSFALRKQGPVTLLLGGGTYDKGPSNACAECHQSRELDPPIPSAGNTADVTSGRWGTHHGPQSNVLSGQGAYVFAGANYGTSAAHNTDIENGCVACHMATPPDNRIGGGHTYMVTYDVSGSLRINAQGICIDCHDNPTLGDWVDDDVLATTDVQAAQAAFETDLAELQVWLGPANLGWLTSDLLEDAGGSIMVPGTYDADQLGALLNWRMLAEDKSMGVHNPEYARDVLDATRAYVLSILP